MNLRIIFCILITSVSYAQNNTFDSIYKQTSRVSSTSSPERALQVLTNLENIATTATERIQVSILRASLLRQYGVRNEAISTLKYADSLALVGKFYNLEARVQGALSTLYRENGIESLGKMALVKAKYWSSHIDNPQELAVFKGNLLQEQAYYLMSSASYVEAITTLTKGRDEFNQIEDQMQRAFYLASTNQLIGKNYIEIKKTDLAVITLKAALVELEQSAIPNSPLKGFIYNDLGISYLLLQDYETSFFFLNKANKVAEEANFFELKKQVFASLKDYAKAVNDMQKYVFYNEQYMQIAEQELNVQTKISNYLVASYHKKEGIVKDTYTKYLVYSLSMVTGSFLLAAFIYVYKQKKQKKKTPKEVVFVDTLIADVTLNSKASIEEEQTEEQAYISKETEDIILEGIQNFELQKGFLKHEVSLSKVASQIGVNHRYLSYVIKHHKQQDFSSYINNLRINYVVFLLQENPEMLKYKISYLAELSGFASHSRFTITFKRIKGISPSIFIEQLKEKA